MNFGWIKGVLTTGKNVAVKHAPEILMALGTVGTGTAVVYAIKAGPNAVYLIEEEEIRKADEERAKADTPEGHAIPFRVPLTWKEKVAACWKIYIPPVGLAIASIGCFWGAHGIDVRRQAVLAGLYSTAETALQEYQRKVIELMGEKQHNEIREAIAEDNNKNTKVPELTTGTNLGANDIWFNMYGKTFPSSYYKVKNVENEFNHEMFNDMTKTVAELIWKLDPTGEFMRPDKEDFYKEFTIDRLLVLHVTNPWGPVATITFEDKDGLEYLPKPRY